MAKPTDELLDLLARALAGDKRAETLLLEKLAPAIREGVVCALFLADVRGQRKRRGPHDCEDFAQDTYEQLLTNDKAALRKFDPTRDTGNLEAYVCKIAKNVTHGLVRTKKSGRLETSTQPEELPESPHHDLDPEMALLNRDLLEYVLAELKLDEAATELFFLHFIDGLDGPVICALLEDKMTLAAFWKWTSRVREKCRDILKNMGGRGGSK